MRKRIYARLMAGLLCGALLFTDAASMELGASSNASDLEQIASLTETDDKNDIDVTNEEKLEEGTAETEAAEPETLEESDSKEENTDTETDKSEKQPREEGTSEKPSKEDTEKEGMHDEKEGEKSQNSETQEVSSESVSENTMEEDVTEELAADAMVMAVTEDIASGSYGNITWVIDASGKLTVSGSGEFSALDVRQPETRAPWFKYKDSIVSAAVKVSDMTDASYMFYSCSNLTSLNLSGFDTKSVTNMERMFAYCRSLPELDLSNFNTANVDNMSGMFESCFALERLNLKSLNTSKVTLMDSMFASCCTLVNLDVSRFDTHNVHSMSQMFRFCSSLIELDLGNFDTSNVTDMWGMFDGCGYLAKLNVSSFDTAKVTDITGMFANCNNLTELDLSGFNVDNAMGYEILEGGDEVLAYCSSLKTIYTPYNLSYAISLPINDAADKWYCSNGTVVTELPQNLSYSVALGKNYIPTEKDSDDDELVDIASGVSKKITWNIDANGTLMVKGTGDYARTDTLISKAPWYEYREEITAAVVDVQDMTNLAYMFYGCSNLLTIDLRAVDTSKVTYMHHLFSGCKSLRSIDLRHFDTGKVTTMNNMFFECRSLTGLDLSSFDTRNVTQMGEMFSRCSSLKKLNLGGFQTEKLYNMGFMFNGCQNLTELNVSHFNTSHVTSMTSVFKNCNSLIEIDISSFDMSKISSADEMFIGCTELKTIYSPYNLSKSIDLPMISSKDVAWYCADGTSVTELPQNLSYSIALGKNYVPTEKVPDNPPADNDPEEESLSNNEKFIQNVTKYSLANADAQTRNSIQKSLYDLLFRAHFAPQGQDPGKTVTFPGSSEFNRKWPYQNGIKAGKTVTDPRLGTVTYAKACAGCLSYARFASQYVYGHIAEATYIRDMSVANVKEQIHEHVDPGEIIGFSNCIHFVVFLGETDDEEGFYCLSYGGGGSYSQEIYHRIEVLYFTYEEFVNKYKYFDGKTADAFLYYDTTGGSFRNQTAKEIKNPAGMTIEMICPGEAVIELNEEKLDSSTPGTASFGIVERDGDQICFELIYSPDYHFTISGTSEGMMSVALTYYDEDGIQIDQRMFINVPITADTEVESSGFDHIADFVLYVLDENENTSAWGAGPGETVYAPDDSFLPETSFEYEVDDETGIHYKDIPETGEIPQGLWISNISDYTYTGNAIKPEVRVYDGEKRLQQGKDYTISYKNNTKAAQSGDIKPPTVVVKGKGNYSGTETQTFNITKRDIADIYVTKSFTDAYAPLANGKNPKLIFSAKCNNKTLKKNTDYTLTVKDSTGMEVDSYVAEGAYSVVVKGVGANYTGEYNFNFEVLNKTPVSKLKINKIASVEYDGTSKRPQPVIKYGKITLNKGTDYSLYYQNNREMGTATITITGKGDYFGTRNVTFAITGRQIKKAQFTGFKSSFQYTGDTVYQSETVLKYGEDELIMGTDYTVSYSNHLDKGKAAVTYIGIGNYTGTLKKTYNITAYNIASDVEKRISLSTDEISAVYAKGGAKPSVRVYDGTQLLTEGKDYTLSYQNNEAVTTPETVKQPTITVKGKGNYMGVLAEKKFFIITPKDIAEVTMTVPDVAASPQIGKYKSTPVLTDTNNKKLKVGTDYLKTYSYTYKNVTENVINDEIEVTRNAGDPVDEKDIIPANTVLCVSITAKDGGNYIGEKTAEYRITTSSISKAKITVQNPNQNNNNFFPYTGQEIRINKSNLIVKVGTDVLPDDQYEILEDTYKNNVSKGTASVQIRGVGDFYGGTATVKFKIGAKGFRWFWRLFG